MVNFPGPATALTCRHAAAKQREKWDSAEDSFTFQAARAGACMEFAADAKACFSNCHITSATTITHNPRAGLHLAPCTPTTTPAATPAEPNRRFSGKHTCGVRGSFRGDALSAWTAARWPPDMAPAPDSAPARPSMTPGLPRSVIGAIGLPFWHVSFFWCIA